MCWDIAADEVGGLESIWIPIVAVTYPLFLWLMAICVHPRDKPSPRGDDGVEHDEAKRTIMRYSVVELPTVPSLQSLHTIRTSNHEGATHNSICSA